MQTEVTVERPPREEVLNLPSLVALLHAAAPPPPGAIARPKDAPFTCFFSSYLEPDILKLGAIRDPSQAQEKRRHPRSLVLRGHADGADILELGPIGGPSLAQEKLRHLRGLVLRGHADGADAERAEFELQSCIGRLPPDIRRQYGPAKEAEECWDCRNEAMLLDGCFIVELLLRHRDSMTTAADRTRWQPSLYRQDILVAPNQIPYRIIEELFRTAHLPELPRGDELDGVRGVLLKRLAISYLVADEAAKELLYGYNDPVYHLLHLLHLHFTFSLHRSPQRTPRPSRARLVGRRVRAVACPAAADAVSRRLATAWWARKAMPTARDLAAVGIEFQPRDTHCLADVAFDGDVLGIPVFTYTIMRLNVPVPVPGYKHGGFDAHLVVNMAALETAGWWKDPQLFVEYAVFMSELVATDEDAGLLRERGVLRGDSPASFFRGLADINEGAKMQGHFAVLIADVNRCYSQLKKASTVNPSSG